MNEAAFAVIPAAVNEVDMNFIIFGAMGAEQSGQQQSSAIQLNNNFCTEPIYYSTKMSNIDQFTSKLMILPD